MFKQIVFATAVSVGLTFTAAPGALAQGSPAPSKAAGTMITPAKTFDAILDGYEKDAVPLAEAMPAANYNFAPTAANFAGGMVNGHKPEYATVSTFGEMVAHMAQANYYYAGAASGMKPDTDVKAIANLKDKDAIVAALKGSFVFAHKAFSTLTPQNAFESVRGDQTRASLAATLESHGMDHYGQLVEYLRMNGIVPPASR